MPGVQGSWSKSKSRGRSEGRRPGGRRSDSGGPGDSGGIGGIEGLTPSGSAPSGPAADPEALARAIVLRKLTAAPRTRAQLETDLARRDVPEQVVERVLDRFTEVGLVDDAAFADLWVRSRHASRGLSRRALGQELRAKGVDPETVAAAVEQLDEDDELTAARALVARKLPSTRGLPREARIRRLVGQLARKGYPGGLAMRTVGEALAAENADASHGMQRELVQWVTD